MVLGPHHLPVVGLRLLGGAIEMDVKVPGPKGPCMRREYRLYGADGSLIIDATEYPEPGIGWDYSFDVNSVLTLTVRLAVPGGVMDAEMRGIGAGRITGEPTPWP
jgi:hypothetical protein